MGNKLKALRSLHNVSAKEIAESLSITAQSYYFKEKGKTQFTLDEAKKIADIFNSTIDEVFYNTSKI